MRHQLPYQNTYHFKNVILNYQVLGRGKPVILLHGSLTNQCWNGFEKLLAGYYQVYIPDMPGFGASDIVSNRLHNTNLFAEVFAYFIKKLNLQKTPIVALSLGTIIAIKTAANWATQGKLILVGLPGKIKGWKYSLTSTIPLFIKRWLVSTNFGKQHVVLPILRENTGIKGLEKKYDKQIFSSLESTDPLSIADPDYKKEVEIDLLRFFPKVKNKMIFIYGEKDALRGSADRLFKKYLTIKDAGHNIFVTRPEETLKVILDII